MPKKYGNIFFAALATFLAASAPAFAAEAPKPAGMSLWNMIVSGGWVMVPLFLFSILAVAIVIYHFMHVTAHKMTPPDFIENLLSLLERKEIEKASSLCRQQPNLISEMVLRGLQKLPKGKAVFEEAIQFEGKARIEKIWQRLTYLGDVAIIAPMLGLLGTIFGMIDAFHFFKIGSVNPAFLTQGLAKAMICTAFGLLIAVPALIFYAFFRGRVSYITSTAERVAAEVIQAVNG